MTSRLGIHLNAEHHRFRISRDHLRICKPKISSTTPINGRIVVVPQCWNGIPNLHHLRKLNTPSSTIGNVTTQLVGKQTTQGKLATVYPKQVTSTRSRAKTWIWYFTNLDFRENKGISLPQLPFEVRSCEVAIIWPSRHPKWRLTVKPEMHVPGSTFCAWRIIRASKRLITMVSCRPLSRVIPIPNGL